MAERPPPLLLRGGHRGDAVRDLQARLLALGSAIDADERGAFGPSTERAVREFQQRRGLVVDGIVGRDTWRELVEASWKLGDRTLYLRSPQLRGDDVRDLQARLSALGFDAGRVDGIFGPQATRALREFQANYGLPADGILGDFTVRALKGLPARAGETPVAHIREREALRRLPQTLAGMRLVLDPGHGGADHGRSGPSGLREDRFAFDLALALEAELAASGAAVFFTRDEHAGPSEHERAALAQRVGADLYIALHAGGAEDPRAGGAAVYFYGNERWESAAGRRLAETILDEAAALGLTHAGAHPKTFAVLRETRMPAVQVEPGFLTNPEEESLLSDPAFVARLAGAIAGALRRFPAEPARA
ncbi:MAG: N-acetylmuramoyl-L-alanine amidase [Acidobacteria bacterium]|nr:N-acetylmuramoyl-L-alanine amidase [Acidobacteriota bacterium]